MSGLSAAYFFLKTIGRDARVLILDNHDDFGGHAKRNEFSYSGHLMAINGGTLNVEAPQRYYDFAKGLLHDIGVDLDRFQTANATNRGL
jgi:spermidine dehydrogenase